MERVVQWAGRVTLTLPCATMKKHSAVMVTKEIFFRPDAAQKPCYFASKYSQVRAVLLRRPCLALHRRALPVHCQIARVARDLVRLLRLVRLVRTFLHKKKKTTENAQIA
jgi:hypothetical protein